MILKSWPRDQDESSIRYRILDGSECRLRILPKFARAFFDVLEEKHSAEKAEKIKMQYKPSTGYEAGAR